MIFQLLSRWYMWWWFCFEIFVLFSSSAEISTQSTITFHYRHSKLDNLTIPGSEWHPCVWSHALMWVPEFGFVYWHHPRHCKSIDTKCGDDSVSCASETWSVHLYISIFLWSLTLFHLSEWPSGLWSHVLTWVPNISQFGFIYQHHPLCCKSVNARHSDNGMSCASWTCLICWYESTLRASIFVSP